jgi:hypothetical protein
MLEIKNFKNIKGRVFGDWEIYDISENDNRYEMAASAKRKGSKCGMIVQIYKEEQANNEYNVRIVYESYGNQIYNDNWIKGGFDTMKTFLTNVGLVVSKYESLRKIK